MRVHDESDGLPRRTGHVTNPRLEFVKECIVWWQGHLMDQLDRIDSLRIREMDDIPSTRVLRLVEHYSRAALDASKHLDKLRERRIELELE